MNRFPKRMRKCSCALNSCHNVLIYLEGFIGGVDQSSRIDRCRVQAVPCGYRRDHAASLHDAKTPASAKGIAVHRSKIASKFVSMRRCLTKSSSRMAFSKQRIATEARPQSSARSASPFVRRMSTAEYSLAMPPCGLV